MATLPTYQRRIVADSTGVQPRASAANDVGQGLREIGAGIGNVGQVMRAQELQAQALAEREAEKQRQITEHSQKEAARAWTGQAITTDHVEWDDWLAKAQEQAKPGAAGFAGDFLKEFDAQTAKALPNAPDEMSRAFYRERRQTLRASYFGKARDFESRQTLANRSQQRSAAIENVATIAARDPEQARTMAEEVSATFVGSPDEHVWREKLRDSSAKAATQGLIERNPELALRGLDAYFGAQTRMPSAAPADDLFGALIQQESRGRHLDASGKLTTSKAGAQGITQLMPTTARNPGYGIEPAKDQSEAEYLRVGREYLGAMLSEFDGDQAKALAAYNAGPGAVQAAVSRNGADWLSRMPAETRDYVRKVSAASAPVLLASASAADAFAALPEGKPLPTGSWFVDALDPQSAWTMRNRAQADVHRIATEQHARKVEGDRLAGEQVKTVAGMLKDGLPPNAQTMATAQTLARGTKWAPLLQEAQQDFTVTSAFRVMPDQQRQAVLDQMRAQGNVQQWTPRQASIFETLTKLDDKIAAAYKADPLRAGLAQNLYPALAPMDTSSAQTMAQTLPARVAQAQAVGARTGKPESPLTAEESAAFAGRLAKLQPDLASNEIAALAQVAGPQHSQAIARQINEKDRPLALAFAAGAESTTAARLTSELILKGAQARKDGTSTKGEKVPDVKAAAWKAHAAAELDGVFGNPETTGQVRDAAELIMHSIAAEKGGRLTRDDMDRAVGLALGGSLVEHNGRKIPLPAGVTQDALDKRLRSVTPLELVRQTLVPRVDGQPQDIGAVTVRAGGVAMPVTDFIKTLPGQQLMSVRPGQYVVIVRGRPVVNAVGEPIVIGMR